MAREPLWTTFLLESSMANWNACWPLMNVMIRYRWLNPKKTAAAAKARKVHKNKVSKFEEFAAAAIYNVAWFMEHWDGCCCHSARPLVESDLKNVGKYLSSNYWVPIEYLSSTYDIRQIQLRVYFFHIRLTPGWTAFYPLLTQ